MRGVLARRQGDSARCSGADGRGDRHFISAAEVECAVGLGTPVVSVVHSARRASQRRPASFSDQSALTR
jgi:hypothetical protein